MEGPLPCNTFYPHSSQGTRTRLLDSLLMSQATEEKRRGYSTHLQQATTCSASSTRIYKTTADQRKHGSLLDGRCYQDSEAEASKRGRPDTRRHPSSQEVARKTSTPLFPRIGPLIS